MDRARTALLVIDLQEKLLPHIHEQARLLEQCARLIDGAKLLQLPLLVTEQYRKGLGPTDPALAGRLAGALCQCEKLRFSACVEPIQQALAQVKARSVLVCGIEAHVCILQSCLDLLQMGYQVFLAVDAVSSRRPADRDAAIARLTQAGVIPTTVESALLEMVGEAGTPCFKAMLPIIK